MALENHPMWRLPKHHLDLKSSHDHVHWVELFYDLIHMCSYVWRYTRIGYHSHFTPCAFANWQLTLGHSIDFTNCLPSHSCILNPFKRRS